MTISLEIREQLSATKHFSLKFGPLISRWYKFQHFFKLKLSSKGQFLNKALIKLSDNSSQPKETCFSAVKFMKSELRKLQENNFKDSRTICPNTFNGKSNNAAWLSRLSSAHVGSEKSRPKPFTLCMMANEMQRCISPLKFSGLDNVSWKLIYITSLLVLDPL